MSQKAASVQRCLGFQETTGLISGAKPNVALLRTTTNAPAPKASRGLLGWHLQCRQGRAAVSNSPRCLSKSAPSRAQAQSPVINLFDVKTELGELVEVALCNNTVTALCARPREIAKPRLGCAGSEAIHLCRQTHHRCSIILLK
jgi:hypothetical protein